MIHEMSVTNGEKSRLNACTEEFATASWQWRLSPHRQNAAGSSWWTKFVFSLRSQVMCRMVSRERLPAGSTDYQRLRAEAGQ